MAGSTKSMGTVRVIVKKNNLPKISKKYRDEMAYISRTTAEWIRDRAKALAPVGTRSWRGHQPGFLRDSIKRVPTRYRLQWAVIVEAPYGAYVEFGTRYMRAQPYLLPAAQASLPLFRERVSAMLKRAGHG